MFISEDHLSVSTHLCSPQSLFSTIIQNSMERSHWLFVEGTSANHFLLGYKNTPCLQHSNTDKQTVHVYSYDITNFILIVTIALSLSRRDNFTGINPDTLRVVPSILRRDLFFHWQSCCATTSTNCHSSTHENKSFAEYETSLMKPLLAEY